ncbi:DUF5412 family protein [Terrihalobacillus insolitus]|uniref:DUF5412 family protein n=1 Tax=Terrihalobacillus insolitus TaxID=2950438 RepID=UPI002341DA4D|nr:DUF5412 family protein [Terrihalobacillus insolitus]MDC3413201.1 DUF5412 domain-containing protein [Terrihalobacillus insolitus]
MEINVIKTYHFEGIYGRAAKATLTDLKTDEEKTIYFNDYDYDPQVIWVSNKVVKIGREKLNINKDIYNYRLDNENNRELPPPKNNS